MKKIFRAKICVPAPFGGNIRPYTKQRAWHRSPFLERPPAPPSPGAHAIPPPPQSNFPAAQQSPASPGAPSPPPHVTQKTACSGTPGTRGAAKAQGPPKQRDRRALARARRSGQGAGGGGARPRVPSRHRLVCCRAPPHSSRRSPIPVPIPRRNATASPPPPSPTGPYLCLSTLGVASRASTRTRARPTSTSRRSWGVRAGGPGHPQGSQRVSPCSGSRGCSLYGNGRCPYSHSCRGGCRRQLEGKYCPRQGASKRD